ncbi:MAG: hypothetical protein J6S73_02465, partial [Lentisphaeria bacterium]|nr:hypothetical protein [Lentisphaeria bacterium]
MLKYFVGIAAALLPWMAGGAEAVKVAAVVPEGNMNIVETAPGVFRMEAKSGANPPGRSAQYCRFVLEFKTPVDLRNRTLSFKASTDTPDKIMAFYVRAYGSNPKKPDGSFYDYTPLFQKNPGTILFRLRERKNSAPLLWEPKAVTGQPAEQITRLQFLVGTRSAHSDIQLTVSDLQLSGKPAGNALEIASIQPERNVKVAEVTPGTYQ